MIRVYQYLGLFLAADLWFTRDLGIRLSKAQEVIRGITLFLRRSAEILPLLKVKRVTSLVLPVACMVQKLHVRNLGGETL